jgi:preprotein translocase subunit SecE
MATTQVQTVGIGMERVKLGVAAVLAVGGLASFYWLGKQGQEVQWTQWASLVLGLALAAGAFFISETGRELVGFGRDAWREVRKVVWPARKEAIQITAYVFGFVLIMAMFLWMTDKTLEWLFYDVILGWKK